MPQVAKRADPGFRLQTLRDWLRSVSAGRLTDWFLLSAGMLLAWTGIEQIGECFRSRIQLAVADPVFGVPFWRVLLLHGIATLVVAGLCLFTRRRMLLLALIVWLAANSLIYRVGLWFMGWTEPYPFFSTLANPWGITTQAAGVIQTGITAYLLCGGIACFIAGLRSDAKAEYTKMSCAACGGHILFALTSLGQKATCPHCESAVTLRKPDENLKMSCFFCQGHIQFPAHAAGTKMECPHCRKDITLKEPA